MNTDKLKSLAEMTAVYCLEKLDLDSVEHGSEYNYPNSLITRARALFETTFSPGTFVQEPFKLFLHAIPFSLAC